MKILIVNKFLYPNGGSETYIFEIGKYLTSQGHEVQYFGMEHAGRIVGNKAGAYTPDMDFHGSKLSKLTYPFKIIYSKEARTKIRCVLDDMQPDVVHLNNINFQITPSVIDEIRAYEKQTGRRVRIIFTAHDYQWICPNHMMNIPSSGQNCDACVGGCYNNCTKNRCIHGSLIKSLLGTIEAKLYKKRKTYGLVDEIICPSEFLYKQFIRDEILASVRPVVRHNFLIKEEDYDRVCALDKQDYVLYFGRFSKEKGIETLIQAMKQLPDIRFIVAGKGPLEDKLEDIPNVSNVGFKSGEELHKLIREAAFSIYPSQWYENCPFSVMESIAYGTPVLGARIGGIPELIEEGYTGALFESGSVEALTSAIRILWNDKTGLADMSDNCLKNEFDTVESYCDWLLARYQPTTSSI